MMLLQPNGCVLFIGDSITDCGRRRPVGEGRFDQALGSGYVSLVEALLTAAYPDGGFQVINMGVSGDTVRDLRARWPTDVLALQPDWLSVMIGINDVWGHFTPMGFGAAPISAGEYARTLGDLVRQAQPGLRGLILMTPYILESDRNEPMRALMDRFGVLVQEIGARHSAVLVDTQAAFDRVLAWLRPEDLAEDRIHINLAGHMLLARAWLQAVGFEWSRGAQGGPAAGETI